MKYRTLGRTGLRVSEIGIGCEGFVENGGTATEALLDECERLGINFIDLYTPNADMRTRLGKALNGRRAQFILQAHLCTIWKEGQYKRTRDIAEVRAGFDDLFTRMGIDYVEIGMVHYVDSMEDWEIVKSGEVIRYALAQKAAGRIGFIGLSSHNPLVAAAAVESGLIDVLMFSINPCYDLMPPDEDVEALFDPKNYAKAQLTMDPDREALYTLCERLGVGITVMKAFGGGDLLSDELSPAGKALTAHQCLHYALTRPAVATVLAGAHTVAELQESASYENASDAARDYASALAALPRISWQGHCMYCGHCAPCPQGIDVAAVTKFLNLARAQGTVPETVREHYAALSQSAGICVRCGACESRCPFGVPVIENMIDAARIFGK